MAKSWTRCVARRARRSNRIIPMKVILPALAALTLLSACAQKPEAVVARSVSPMMYASLDCTALQAERHRIHSQVTNLTAAQRRRPATMPSRWVSAWSCSGPPSSRSLPEATRPATSPRPRENGGHRIRHAPEELRLIEVARPPRVEAAKCARLRPTLPYFSLALPMTA